MYVLMAALLVLASPASAWTEESPRPAAELVKRLPKPAAAAPLRFAGAMRIRGVVFANLTLEVRAGERGTWFIRETMDGTPDSGLREVQELVLDAALLPSQGALRRSKTMPGRLLREDFTWKRLPAGLVLRDGEGRSTRPLEVHGPVFATLAQAAFLLRGIAGPEKSAYRMTYLDIQGPQTGGPRLETALLRSHGLVSWNGRQVWMTSARRPDKGVEIAFDPATRRVLGMRLVAKGGGVVEVLPGHKDFSVKSTHLPPAWRGDAATPKIAAARLVYAMAARDVATLDRSIHWSAAAKAQRPAREPAAFRTTFLQRLQGLPPPQDVKALLGSIQTSFESAQVTMQGEHRAIVTAQSRNADGSLGTRVTVHVAQSGTAWLGAAIPTFTAPDEK